MVALVKDSESIKKHGELNGGYGVPDSKMIDNTELWHVSRGVGDYYMYILRGDGLGSTLAPFV